MSLSKTMRDILTTALDRDVDVDARVDKRSNGDLSVKFLAVKLLPADANKVVKQFNRNKYDVVDHHYMKNTTARGHRFIIAQR